MVSDFLVCHPSGPFFRLNEKEFDRAVQQYPHLSSMTDVQYLPRSATAGINVGSDNYFDETVLAQFERLFQLIKFKSDFAGHDIEVLVDNARTHTAKEYSLNQFGKNIGTRCPIKSIDYLDSDGKERRISCYFESGKNRGTSKGLFVLAKELNLQVPTQCKLDDLQQILSKHPAFANVRIIYLFIFP